MPDKSVAFVNLKPDEMILADRVEAILRVVNVGLIPTETTCVVLSISVNYGFHDNHLFIFIIPHVSSDKWRIDAEFM